MQCKGFIYKGEDGAFVLSKEPDLKTCCVGKKEGQIFLEGNFSACEAYKAYKVEGKLVGNHLQNAHLVEGNTFPLYSLMLLLLIPLYLIKRSK